MNPEVVKPRLLYFGDPMCSWCWGIAGHLEKVMSYYSGKMDFELVMGGLRVGGGEEWNDQMKDFLRNHWNHVQEASGQEFNFALLERESFNYDTEPACRAVATVKNIALDKTFNFYRNVQFGFYVENGNPSELEFYHSACKKSNVDFKGFSEVFNSQRSIFLVKEDFSKTRRFGISGFPSMVLDLNGRFEGITRGYATFEHIRDRINSLL